MNRNAIKKISGMLFCILLVECDQKVESKEYEDPFVKIESFKDQNNSLAISNSETYELYSSYTSARDSCLLEIRKIKLDLVELSGGFHISEVQEFKKTGRFSFYNLSKPHRKDFVQEFFYQNNPIRPYAINDFLQVFDSMFSSTMPFASKMKVFQLAGVRDNDLYASFGELSVIESIDLIDRMILSLLRNENEILSKGSTDSR